MTSQQDQHNSDSEAYPPTWSERNYQALKISVIVMGVLIVLGMVLVVVTIINRVSSAEEEAAAQAMSIAVDADIARLLDPDGEVVATETDGNRLAVVIRRPDGNSILVIDLRSGQVLSVLSPSLGGAPAQSPPVASE